MDSSLFPLFKAGLHVEVRPPDRLIVSGHLTAELRHYIRTHKAEILLALEDGNCQRCSHLRRPGAAKGYCSKREDLTPVYGPGHPLRVCPVDRGENCEEYSPKA